MYKAIRFFWRTIVGGVLFLGPLLLLLIIAHQAVRLIARVLNPVASHIPIRPRFGFDTPELAAVIVLIFLGFVAGLVAQTAIAQRLREIVEQLILSKMPGYTLFKAVAEGAAGMQGQENVKVGIAQFDDNAALCFIIEHHADGNFTVFVPSAPTPTAGSIYYLPPSRIKQLDVPVSAAIKCIMKLGVGSRELLEGKVTANVAPKSPPP